MITSTLGRAGAVLAVATVAVIAPALTASAHVTVTAPGAVAGGGDQEITFRVPVEKDVKTVGLTVAFPTSTPIADLLVEPVPGWTHSEKSVTLKTPIVTDDGKITDAVSQVTWRARAGEGLAPGEFGAFTVIAGQLPDAKTLTFKAIQRYADGSQVAWTQTEAPGSDADLEHPAPVLTLGPAAPDADSDATGDSAATATGTPAPTTAATPATAAAATSSPAADSTRANWALGVGIVAALAAVGALALAGRGRRQA